MKFKYNGKSQKGGVYKTTNPKTNVLTQGKKNKLSFKLPSGPMKRKVATNESI
jgi:hypothetical protein